MMKFKDDVSSEVLEKSLRNRKYNIDWSSLDLFKYIGETEAKALLGKSVVGNLSVRIAFRTTSINCQRPFCVFYKQKENTQIIKEAYYLSDEECDRFNSLFETKH